LRKILLEIALSKALWIRGSVERSGLEEVLARARELWVEHKPEGFKLERYGAVDGSNNEVEFKGLTLYAVLGYAVAKTSSGVVEYEVGDVDVMLHGDTSERVRLLREISEVKAAVLASEPDLLMFDGSITSLLIRPRPYAEPRLRYVVEKLWVEAGRDVVSRLWAGLKKQLSSGSRALYDHYISHHIAREHGLFTSSKLDLTVLLEYFEKLLSIRLLLEQRVVGRKHPALVFISKTSRSRDYFHSYESVLNRTLPPDVVIYSYATRSVGFSKPVEVEREEVKNMPRYGELEELIAGFYSRLSYVLTYFRLAEGGPVLMVEIPVDRDVVSENAYTDIVHTVSESLHPLSYNGYPYPLIEAHKNSLITREDVQSIAMLLGLIPRPTGREVLLEWL